MIPGPIAALYESVARQQALFSRILPLRLQRFAIDYYLLYRILDTVEDTGRTDLLDLIGEDFISGLGEAASLLAERVDIPLKYKNLCGEWPAILDFHLSFAEESRMHIEITGMKMARGMRQFIGKPLTSITDLQDYCYYVAGIVGELSDEFFGSRGGVHLGIYLQLVNILRDYRGDVAGGRRYPPVSEVVALARTKEKAIERYLESQVRGEIRSYCDALYRVAKLHFDAYEKGMKPSAAKIFARLPLKLKMEFVRYKIIR